MTEIWIFTFGAATGYALAIYSWASVRAFFGGAEQELASLRSRAVALEAKLRAALGRGES